ncbi:MAG: PQQ-binding-like beta-propeller repeat protein [Bacteroidales bacterium]
MKTLFSIALFFFIFSLSAQEFSQWRGVNRDGIYDEPGLLTSWPVDGPPLLWMNESLPDGHSSMAVTSNSVYLTGKVDTMDILVALDLTGKIRWQVPFGRAWNQSFPESRCTPTVEGDKIYVSSGLGDLACIDANNGKIIWTMNAAEKFGAKFNDWGVAESLIIKGNLLYFSPVGKQTTTIALNKQNGQVVWKSESIGDSLAYVSPILVNYGGKEFLVNVSASNIYAVDANDGKILWKFDYFHLSTPKDPPWPPVINCTTPVYSDGKIYISSGYNHVGVMLKLNPDATGVEMLWYDNNLDNHHGGVVKIGEFIYGSNWINNGMGEWCCIDWNSGKTLFQTKWNNKGSIIANKDMLYCYDEKSGNVGLFKANPEKFEPVSTFKIKKGNGPFWAHPVIHNGVLYIRHGKALMAYNIKG